MTLRKTLRLLLGALLGALFLYLVVRRTSLAELRSAFGGASLPLTLAALAAFAIGYACRIERWRLMLAVDSPGLPWRRCAGPLLASFALNNVLPFRAGDALRSFGFNGTLGTTSGVIIATLFAERLLDLLMVLLLLGLALAVFRPDSALLSGVGSPALFAAAALVLAVLFFPRIIASPVLAAGHLVARLAPRWGLRVLDEIRKSLGTLEHISRGRAMAKLVAWSLLAWLAEGCVFWFAALSLPSISAPWGAWLALPVGTLATLIPSTPGYVGTFDFFTAQAMTSLGNAMSAATAYALLVHALIWLPPTLVGGLYLMIRPGRPDNHFKTASR